MTHIFRPLDHVLHSIEAFLRLGETSVALQAIEAVAAVQPDLITLHVLRGWYWLLLEQPERAIVSFRLAVGRDPTDALAWHGIAEVSRNAAERDAAAERAEWLHPQGAQAQLWHDLAAGRAHLAVTPLHAHCRRFPERAELTVWLAEAHRRLGNREQAASLIDPLLRRRPRAVPALFLAAAIADGETSQQYLEDALRLDPLGSVAHRFCGPDLPFTLPAAPSILIVPELDATLEAMTPMLPVAALQPVRTRTTVAKAAEIAAPLPPQPVADQDALAALQAVEQATLRVLGRVPLVASNQATTALLVLHAGALTEAYGSATADAIKVAVDDYGAALSTRGIQAEAIIVDDRSALAKYGAITPAAERSAAAYKQTVDAVQAAITATGREVGAVVLIGGDSLIPFHRLANPSQDADVDVPSDNPYGSGAGSEYAPDRIVARFPDGGADNGKLLLDQLERAADYHRTWQITWPSGGLLALPFVRKLTKPLRAGGPVPAWGVSAETWTIPSQTVYDELGYARPIVLCPPATPERLAAEWPDDARVLYFNVHGIQGGPNWYGQASDATGDVPLPVLLTPEVITDITPGTIGFSEACYGAEITGRSPSDAIGLRMLQQGAGAFIGSTVTAYGAVTLPLGGADVLVQQTILQLRRGHPLGQALVLARDWMARDMVQRQGYLDPDDAKTLLSFVLLGDPWITPYARPVLERKTALPQITPVLAQRRPIATNLVTPAASTSVRQLLAKVVPHLARANLSVVGQGRPDRIAKGQASAVVFSATEAVPTRDGRTLAQIARVTVAGGTARKLLLSR